MAGRQAGLPGVLAPPSVLDDPAPRARLPFYPLGETWLPGGVDGVQQPLHRDPACKRCGLHKAAKAVCVPAYGPEGAPLLVLPSPTAADDAAGRLLQTGVSGDAISEARHHVPEVRVTWALRCSAGRQAEAVNYDACRPYLATEVDLAPRVLLLGPEAAMGVLGVHLDARRSRRARAWARSTPCYLLHHPGGLATRNRFLRRQFQQDVAWALLDEPRARPAGDVEVLLTPPDAVAWLEAVTRDPLVVDCEYWPGSPWAVVPEKDGGKFRLLCMGLCQDPARPVVIPEEVLADPRVVAALRRVLEDPTFPKANQSIKGDRHVIWRVLGVDLVGVQWDTEICSRLLDSDAPAGLSKTAWRVGFGGFKELGRLGSDEDDE